MTGTTRTPASGYLTRFEVLRSFLDHYEVHQAGGKTIPEHWDLAEDLPALNVSAIGPRGGDCGVLSTAPTPAEADVSDLVAVAGEQDSGASVRAIGVAFSAATAGPGQQSVQRTYAGVADEA